MAITSERFGRTRRGEDVWRFTLSSGAGIRVQILSYGCTVQRVIVPDCAGKPTDVVLGYDDLRSYETGSCWFGAFLGRYANRIRGGVFTLDGVRYSLPKNDGENHLHGVFSHAIHDAAIEGEVLIFRRLSPAGEEGFPGMLATEVRCRLDEAGALSMVFRAATDAPTVLNLSNHMYFNLNGDGADILGHRLRLDADAFTPCGAGTIPTGEILPVSGTPMDFRTGKTLGADIDADFEQLRRCRGYDHNYVLRGAPGTLREIAEAVGEKSGIRLTVSTTQPGVQLYTGNFIAGDTAPCGKGGVRYPNRAGFCLETQHYPCSPNFPAFPSTVLRPGETYQHETVYRFGAAHRRQSP